MHKILMILKGIFVHQLFGQPKDRQLLDEYYSVGMFNKGFGDGFLNGDGVGSSQAMKHDDVVKDGLKIESRVVKDDEWFNIEERFD